MRRRRYPRWWAALALSCSLAACGEESRRELAEARAEFTDVQREHAETREELKDVAQALGDASQAAGREAAARARALRAELRQTVARLVVRASTRVAPSGAPSGEAPSTSEHVRCHRNHCTITRELLSYLERHPEVLLSQGTLTPVSNSREQGLRAHDVKPGSVPAALGIQDGDLLTAVDDIPMRALVDLGALRNSRPGDPEFSFTFRRDGVERRVLVRIADADGARSPRGNS